MVNYGPSTGCEKCRQRHIKCDKTKPACRRCIVRGYACPGYRDFFGVVFKDETRRVVEKQSRRSRTFLMQSTFTQLTELKIDAHSVVIPFFFDKHILAQGRTVLTSRGHFDYLVAMYSNAAPSSPLALATFATAARAMASHLCLEQNTMWHVKNDVAASEAIMKAVMDPEESLRDETLLAVLCLDFGTHFSQSKTLPTPSRAHLDGALALIHHRGPRNLDSPVARSLFAATRSNVLLQMLWYKDQRSQDAAALFPDIDVGMNNPIINLHFILLKVIKFRMLAGAGMRSVNEQDTYCRRSSCLKQARDLLAELDEWIDGLPWDWKFMSKKPPPSGPWPAPNTLDHIPFTHVVSLHTQWQCTRLMVLKSCFAAVQWEYTWESEQSIENCEKLRFEAQGSAETICRLLAYLGVKFNPVSAHDEFGGMVTRKLGDSYRGSDIARMISLNISGWVLFIFAEKIPGAEGFEIAPNIMEYLRNEYQEALAALQGISPYNQIACNIQYV